MTITLQFASFYDGQEVFVWSDSLLDLGTDFLVGSMVFVQDKMARSYSNFSQNQVNYSIRRSYCYLAFYHFKFFFLSGAYGSVSSMLSENLVLSLCT